MGQNPGILSGETFDAARTLPVEQRERRVFKASSMKDLREGNGRILTAERRPSSEGSKLAARTPVTAPAAKV